MLKTDVGSVRQAVNRHIGSKVVVRCNLGRHKVDVTEGNGNIPKYLPYHRKK